MNRCAIWRDRVEVVGTSSVARNRPRESGRRREQVDALEQVAEVAAWDFGNELTAEIPGAPARQVLDLEVRRRDAGSR